MDRKTVDRVSKLAKIRLKNEEAEEFVPQLSNIMGFIEKMNEVNTDNVEPFSGIGLENKLRVDEVSDGNIPDDVLANAPEQQENYFVVRKIVE